MAYVVMAYIVMAYVVMAYVVMAYIVMACVVMAYIVMACVVMAWHTSSRRSRTLPTLGASALLWHVLRSYALLQKRHHPCELRRS